MHCVSVVRIVPDCARMALRLQWLEQCSGLGANSCARNCLSVHGGNNHFRLMCGARRPQSSSLLSVSSAFFLFCSAAILAAKGDLLPLYSFCFWKI